ncbi:DUF1667 domain-containing protein [Oscillospiraceae bacterium LTW-04]|nr:DUF1667 domain-containing protein [Oscillospiraceae bacterium MB24-C1]
MTRTFTCIMCPNGCEICAELDGATIVSLEGARCEKGKSYVRQEIDAPKRNIASSVLLDNGTLPLASIRLTGVIPKERIFDAMAEIRKVRVTAPVSTGQTVIKDLLDLGCDVIITKSIPRCKE